MTLPSTRSADAEGARRWLLDEGATCGADGVWRHPAFPGGALTAGTAAHLWADMAVQDPRLGAEEVVRIVLGLMDLCDEPGVTAAFSAWADAYEETRAHLWAAYRPRLEAVEEPRGVLDSLAHWFEDGFCASACFHGVLGGEAASLPGRLRPGAPGRDALLRRVRRVLSVAGPVPLEDREPVYEAVAGVPELRGVR
ncbi:hypothetical protein ACPB9J_10530 [Streptomyces lavendulocolor]|uniref:hypothetical protein n=1 Tax=Streptomyces lavendulocolor TaxID=67316 RepID=UPI003C30B273